MVPHTIENLCKEDARYERIQQLLGNMGENAREQTVKLLAKNMKFTRDGTAYIEIYDENTKLPKTRYVFHVDDQGSSIAAHEYRDGEMGLPMKFSNNLDLALFPNIDWTVGPELHFSPAMHELVVEAVNLAKEKAKEKPGPKL